MQVQPDEIASLVSRLVLGDVRALARAVSLVEDRAPSAGSIVAGCREVKRRSRRVGVTGAGGVGKSTLVDQLVRQLRSKGERVAVIAVDPTSPFTGGALLGDRIRMRGFADDGGVFIRSMASRGETGGVAKAAESICILMEAAGFGTVLMETVGAGQGEVSVTGFVDVTLLVLVPGMGDDVQSLKAGIMEAADVFVVNKADQLGADQVEAELMAMQSLSGRIRPVLRTSGLLGDGISELLAVLEPVKAAAKPAGIRGSVTLDHVAVAMRSIEAARGFYEALGGSFGPEEVIVHEQVRVRMVPLGAARLELLEAAADDSVIGKFIARRGEGLHHIAVRVDGIDACFQQMQASGVKLVSDCVRTGAGGHRYFFVHPSSTGGVLVELVGD